MSKEKVQVYLAGRFSERERIVGLMKQIEEVGGKITYNWTLHKPISPYYQNQEMAAQYAEGDIGGVAAAEVVMFVLPQNGDSLFGTGSSVELGAALERRRETGDKPRIIIVGNRNQEGLPLFAFHNSVECFKSFEAALDEIME